jgi:hypothetical protein
MSPESAAAVLSAYSALSSNAAGWLLPLPVHQPTFEEFATSGFLCNPAMRGTLRNAIRCLAANGSWSFKRTLDGQLQHTADSQQLFDLAWKLSVTQFR